MQRHKTMDKRQQIRKEKAELEARRRFDQKKRSLQIVERLTENDVDEGFFIDCGKFINPEHYGDVVVERSIEKLCGYPMCQNLLVNSGKQKYHISTKANKVYDITERKCFCSQFCYRASKFYQGQLSSAPLWTRTKDSQEELKLLSPNWKPGPKDDAPNKILLVDKIRSEEVESPLRGEKVDIDQLIDDVTDDVTALSLKDARERQRRFKEFEERLEKTNGSISEKKEDLVRNVKDPGHAKEHLDAEENSVDRGDQVKINSVSCKQECLVNTKSSSHSSPGENNKSLGEPEDKTASKILSDCEKGNLEIISKSSLKETNLKINENKNTVEVDEGDIPTKCEKGHSNTSPKNMSEQKDLSSECADDLNLDNVGTKQTGLPHASSPDTICSDKGSQALYDRRVSGELTAQEVKNVSSKQSKVKTKALTVPVLLILEQAEKCLKEWKTLKTYQFLTNTDSSKLNKLQKSTTERPVPEIIKKDIDLKKSLEDKMVQFAGHSKEAVYGRDGPSQTYAASKPLPDFNDLKMEPETYSLKVKEFYSMQPEKIKLKHLREAMKKPSAAKPKKKEKEEAEDDRPILLPLVDSKSQMAIRRKIILDKIHQVLRQISAPLGLSIGDFSSDLHSLVSTFELSSQNITFKPAGWTLVTIMLFFLLLHRNDSLKAKLSQQQSTLILASILKAFQVTRGDLKGFADRYIQDEVAEEL